MGVDTEFREVLWNIQQVKKQKLGPAFSEIGLTAGQPRVLTRLLKKDGITQKELSDICLIDSTTLSRILDKLEQMGLILRQNNPCLLYTSVVLGVGHIGIHLGHLKAWKRKK